MLIYQQHLITEIDCFSKVQTVYLLLWTPKAQELKPCQDEWLICWKHEQWGEVGHISPSVALKGALNQSWEVLLIIRVSLMDTDETDTLYKTLLPNMCVYVEIFICYKKAHLPLSKVQRYWSNKERSSNSKYLIEVACSRCKCWRYTHRCELYSMLSAHQKLGFDYGSDPF